MTKSRLYFITYFVLIQVSLAPVKCQSPFEDENGILREVVLDPGYKTIQLYREGWQQSYPVVRLDGDVPLVLEFDDLSDCRASLYYQVIHCNADWTISELTDMEYLVGYPENEVPGGSPLRPR